MIRYFYFVYMIYSPSCEKQISFFSFRVLFLQYSTTIVFYLSRDMCRTETDYYRPDNYGYCKIEEEIRKRSEKKFLETFSYR